MSEEPSPFSNPGIPMATSNMVFAIFGAYLWELCQTLNAEYTVIRLGKAREFPLVAFALCRIFALGALLGSVVASISRTEIDCRGLYIFNSWAGDTTIFLATILLFHRTSYLWKDRRIVKYPLLALGFLQLALLYTRTFTAVEGAWDFASGKCVRQPWHHAQDRAVAIAALFTSAGVHLVALCLAAVPIFTRSAASKGVMARLNHIFLVDGWIWYWGVFAINFAHALNYAMPHDIVVRSILTTPAVGLTTIAACRLLYMQINPPPQATGGDSFAHSSVLVTGSASLHPSAAIPMKKTPTTPHYPRTLAGIRVTTADLAPEDFGPYSPPHDPKDDDDVIRRLSIDSDRADALSLKFATNPV